jgi:hypothetical protein
MTLHAKPLVSVTIPTYNRAALLPEALDSVYAQEAAGELFETEVIVVDDASTDATPEVVRRYPGVRYIRLETNRGSRRHGMPASGQVRGSMWLGSMTMTSGFPTDCRRMSRSWKPIQRSACCMGNISAEVRARATCGQGRIRLRPARWSTPSCCNSSSIQCLARTPGGVPAGRGLR